MMTVRYLQAGNGLGVLAPLSREYREEEPQETPFIEGTSPYIAYMFIAYNEVRPCSAVSIELETTRRA